jgi:hypothetical protein
VAIIVLALSLPVGRTADQEITAAALIARHLEASGLTGEGRASHKSRVMVGMGSSSPIVGGQGGLFTGRAILLTQEQKIFLKASFNDPRHEGEVVAYDGEEIRATDTVLGRFTRRSKVIIEEGLFGGILSLNWALQHTAERRPRIEYRGLKRIGDDRLYQLKYVPRRGARENITIYIEPETYRHVMTRYTFMIEYPTPQLRGRTMLYSLEERFGDFREFDGFDLPHRWRLRLSTPTSTLAIGVECQRFYQNVPIDPQIFLNK